LRGEGDEASILHIPMVLFSAKVKVSLCRWKTCTMISLRIQLRTKCSNNYP